MFLIRFNRVEPFRFIPCFFVPSLVLALLTLAVRCDAQSLHVESPAPLAAGLNHATIDSFGSSHYWSFTAQPGSFKVAFTFGNPQEGFSTGGRPVMAAAFGPKTPGANMTYKEFPGGTTWTGSVTQPTRVVIEVDPVKGMLVRQTTSYTLQATGSASFSGVAGAAPSVAGVYAMNFEQGGTAKFMLNGEIVSTTDARGTWKLFDTESKTYVVLFGGKRFSLTYQPGRGFVDNNGMLVFTQKH
jgi:hypothetical protein